MITVKDLISELQKHDENLPIILEDTVEGQAKKLYIPNEGFKTSISEGFYMEEIVKLTKGTNFLYINV